MPPQLSDQQLSLGYWLVQNRQNFRNIGVAILIILNLGLWGYSSWRWIKVFAIDKAHHEAMMAEFSANYVNYEGVHTWDAPLPFVNLGAWALDAGGGRYDLVAKLRNPNNQWLALIEYRFTASDPKVTTKIYKDFILPGDYKYFMDLGVESKSSLATPRINIVSLRWQKVVGALQKKSKALRIDVSDAKFLGNRGLGLGDALDISRVEFKAKNNSSYNFWKVGFSVVVLAGTKPVAVNYLLADDFVSGSEKFLDVSFFNKLSASTGVEVKPDLNIWDMKNYRDFSGALGADIKDFGDFRRQ
ncbi:MAG: Uncharacterized protein G01um101418_212 [Parcubacteria group bacterium Gr01-1014_18]|nr:MAG: Uncharacterized protein Greene041636_180 [Parcubacteria group bacterium Greene0416_36]TSC81372.1 MAG: Uncharacterized protein G01um101418_212 [Parcubacteria group bacterium Gr01-1014_18]TSC99442.1 MAG: Uncharacterized protein Greene101420_109 [Parcubacteria group bacterium Greene1014_20]TSD07639.1 MAG: Uncharacterized protein Greene07142_96 [Parcubacteria group bacterium Greene0714_2]